MKETIKKILSEVPSSTEIYVFGSVLRSLQPNDLDILVIYDSKVYPKANIYDACKRISEVLYEAFNLPIDLTVLSYSENDAMNFIKEVKARELKFFLQGKFFKDGLSEK
ncbi:DNA polymerase III subunit beta [Clostridium carboxidivorans P7]|uniref:DNA polymerase beta domain protein region n=1 Tax=Clostridium carboxidivorans P7 TaxID=536227 RepID=C6PXT9_9CLOT|nr:nucleotidyltransferase domain-containing protein [Clostridium carboxidivorans]AKN31870.1 DNA polymerase III subunit beta [Clostridium carboxidivorans P7]EET85927.1 DNA polymerase beta domain protein region [Clostridium carboxidivorans P7]EFG87280.1 nucleotidyltransferase domain protein [Clostridium carboxidivorans P7]